MPSTDRSQGRHDPVQGRPHEAASGITRGAFRYATYASSYLDTAQEYARAPVKQVVIAREAFIDDLVREAQTDIRKCLDSDATVQIDFTEGRYPGCSRTSTGSSSKERGKPLVVPAQ